LDGLNAWFRFLIHKSVLPVYGRVLESSGFAVIYVVAINAGRIPLGLSAFNLFWEFTEIEFVSVWNQE
jgi:hypothetical protein